MEEVVINTHTYDHTGVGRVEYTISKASRCIEIDTHHYVENNVTVAVHRHSRGAGTDMVN